MRAKRAAVATSIAAAGIGVIAGAGWGLGRLASRQLRSRRVDAATPDDDGPRDTLDPPADRIHTVTTADGAALHVLDRGAGPPVVLVHGYTLSAAVWTLQLAKWPRLGRRVIAYDQRGHGRSTVGSDGITAASLAADLRAVLEDLDLSHAVLVGHSLGGMVLQALAVEHPDVVAVRVDRLVLLSTAARGVSWVESPLAGVVERATGLYGRLAPSAMSRRELGFFLASIGVGPRSPTWIVERTQELTKACSPATMAAAGRVLLRFDLSEAVRAVTTPTLVICGRLDRLTPPRESVRLAERIPGARLEVLPGVGHMVMLEAPDRLQDLVLAPRDHGAAASGDRRRGGAVITAIPGIRVGHWTGYGTGVTAVLAPSGTVGSGEVRGGAPAARETALLEPARLVERVDAVVLAGGSAFGLAAADGAMRFLAERGQGFPTAGGPVPIVVAACIFDLVESGGERPGVEAGYAACVEAELGEPTPPAGRIGAGRGATIGKWRGVEYAVPGGFGTASRADGPLVVGALAVVNAAGDVIGPDGSIVAGSTAPPEVGPFARPVSLLEHTTLVVCATNARLSRPECFLLAQSGHHGLAVAVRPSHTRFDGDVVFSLATGDLDGVPVDLVRLLAVDAVAAAVRSAAGAAAV